MHTTTTSAATWWHTHYLPARTLAVRDHACQDFTSPYADALDAANADLWRALSRAAIWVEPHGYNATTWHLWDGSSVTFTDHDWTGERVTIA